MTTTSISNAEASIEPQVEDFKARYQSIEAEVGKVIVGHKEVVAQTILCLMIGGHALLEGVPGLGKTMLVRTLSQVLDLQFSRIQFTPDLMPADIVGTSIVSTDDAGQRSWQFQPGPIFGNLILADEINRAPAKVQSALLEAMQERQVTIGETTFKLEEPFLVLATQNPIEQEGTYPLPEAQVDRFMLKLKIGYPTRAEERQILDTMARTSDLPTTKPVVDPRQILNARKVINDIYVDDKVKDYIVDLVCATRDPDHYKIQVKDFIQLGASPRATIALTLAAKAYAFLKGRGYVTPQDVKSIGMDVLRHRVAITYEAEAEDKTSETVIQKIFDELPVP